MHIVSLSVVPPSVPARPPLQVRPCRPCEINLTSIARRLGIVDRPRRTIIDRVRLLAEAHGFPLPKTPRFVNGIRQTGPQSIDARSIWDRDVVELWFDNDRPPGETKAFAEARKLSVREQLSQRALTLVAG